jgi:dienelactone hydrolase
MYFRGTNNTLATLKYLNDVYQLFNGSNIVVTGVSAGGLATLYWANHIQE